MNNQSMGTNNTHFDVFNGDADGIIALVQLRLAEPKTSRLITGVKRDIKLIEQVEFSQAKSMTVLDISMEKNSESLIKVLSAGVDVFYVDHHRSGDIPQSTHLNAIIDTDANTCTSLLVNQHLKGQYKYWAIAAAFGDNMTASAKALSNECGLSESQQEQLKDLGIYVNYNGYGQQIEDLHFHPASLYQELVKYENPFDLIAAPGSIYSTLAKAYQADMLHAEQAEVLADNDVIKVVRLPDQAWARRVSGVFGNELANEAPNKAHAVLTHNAGGTSYTISVRAPLNNKQGADSICIQFPTGGGRAGAAGINQLPEAMLAGFIDVLFNYYQK